MLYLKDMNTYKEFYKYAEKIPSLGSGGYKIRKRLMEYAEKCEEETSILEVGSFLGSATAYICIGIQNSKKKINLWCCDKWVADKIYQSRVKRHLNIDFELDQDLLPVFEKNIEVFNDVLVQTHKGDFSEVKEWNGNKISMVVYDPGCSIGSCNTLVNVFEKNFMPNKTIFFFMDYYFYTQPNKKYKLEFNTIRCFLEKNKECFKFIERVGNSQTGLFLYTGGKMKELSKEDIYILEEFKEHE